MNLFQASVSDQSLTYLYAIFGSMNGVIPVSGSQASSATTITLLGTMFKTFNSVILAVGALIVVYVTIVGVMETAHEGQAMGKEWNNLWIPIRIVMGIASLVPTGSGYSGIQIVMMWVIIQGIGAADTLWATALTYVSVVGSPYAEITPPGGKVRLGLKGLFTGMLCYKASAQTLANVYPTNGPDNSYYCNPKAGNGSYCSGINSNSFAPSFSDNTPYQMGPAGACGTFSFCDEQKSCTANPADKSAGPNTLACLSCKAQLGALKEIAPTFALIADKYIDVDYQYTKFYFASAGADGAKVTVPNFVQQYCSAKGIKNCVSENLPKPMGNGMSAPDDVVDTLYWPYALKEQLASKDFIASAVEFYQGKIGGALTTYFQTLTNTDQKLNGILQTARDNGWILAGSYYLTLARSNSANLQASMPTIDFNEKSDSLPSMPGSPLYKYRNDYNAAKRLVGLASGAVSPSGGNGAVGEASQVAGDGAADVGAAMLANVKNKGTDPLTQLSATGYTLISVAGIMYIAFLLIVFIASLVANLSIMFIGSGLPENPVGGGVADLMLLIMPLVVGLIGMMLAIGSTLAIYIPLIPYTIFTIGAIGWMISCIEAMVAGPLVALGVLVPSGHHKLLGKAEPALMLLFNIFLRPSLMIFGLFAAILLSTVVLKMINTGFATVFATLFDFANTETSSHGGGGQAAAAFNPLALVFVLVFYVTLITSALNKTFSAIHIIPENVMRWIGGQGERYGEEAALGEVKQAVSGAASKASDGAQAVGSSASSARGELNQQIRDQKGKSGPTVKKSP